MNVYQSEITAEVTETPKKVKDLAQGHTLIIGRAGILTLAAWLYIPWT